MTYEEALSVICAECRESDAIRYLTTALNKKYELEREKACNRRACLNAIRKINKGKNEAIDALCDDDENNNAKHRVADVWNRRVGDDN